MNSHLIIRLCRHTFSDGRHCEGAAVRGRACCRHHLDARTRLHNMARARRLACIPRLRVPMTPRDLAGRPVAHIFLLLEYVGLLRRAAVTALSSHSGKFWLLSFRLPSLFPRDPFTFALP